MKKGEIVLIELPLSNGHEQRGLRPAIIFSEELGKMIVVIPLTTKTSALKYPFTINLENSKLNGLKENSTALLFQLHAIDKKRIKNKLGELEENLLKEIDSLLIKMLKLK